MKISPSIALALMACCPTGAAWAQAKAADAGTSTTSTTSTASPTAEAKTSDTSPSLLETLKLPNLRDMKLPLPRSVQAANALLGLATQRLALVMGTGNIGPQIQLPAISRDTQAIAAALRAAGFVVMVREDLNAEEMRATLDEFRNRLHPGGVGFLYFSGLGAQLGGENVILTRGLTVTGTGPETRIKGTAVPLQEIVEAVQGTPESPRYLVVDAAFSHPTLAALGSKGLGPQKLPPGLMGLFSQSPGVAGAAPEPFALPLPTPTDPRLLAGSPFGRELVRSLVTPKLSGGDILRVTRGAMLDVSAGQQAPVLVGENANKDEFAEPNLLDTLFPRTPEEMAREALKQAMRGGGSAGEVPVSQLANSAPAPTTPSLPATTAPTTPPTAQTEDLANNDVKRPDVQRSAADSASRRLADAPSPTSALSTAAGTAATAATAATTVAGAAATTAAVAGTVAAGAVMAKATAATTAVGVVTSVASSAVGVLSSVASLVTGGGGGSGGSAAAVVTASEASKLVRPTSVAAANRVREGAAASNAAAPAVASAATAANATTAAATAGTTAAPSAAVGAATAAAAPTTATATATAAATTAGQGLSGSQAAQLAASTVPAQQSNQQTATAAPGAAAQASANPGAGANATPTPATTQAAGADLPVSAVNQASTPVTAEAQTGLPPATPRTAVPDSFSAADTVAAGNPLANPNTAARTQAQKNGGERPAYVPKVNPFGYTEGDTFMYRVMDTWKNQHMGNTVQTVEEVLPNGHLVANGQQTVMDAQGRFKRVQNLDGSVSQFEPAQELWWSNPARGQSKDVLFKERFQRADNVRGQTEWKGSTSVGRPRTISTPAGDFEVLPIESSGWYYEQLGRGPVNSGQWSRTVWYSPKLGHPVAIDIEDANSLGKLLRRERVELLQAHTARSSAAATAP